MTYTQLARLLVNLYALALLQSKGTNFGLLFGLLVWLMTVMVSVALEAAA